MSIPINQDARDFKAYLYNEAVRAEEKFKYSLEKAKHTPSRKLYYMRLFIEKRNDYNDFCECLRIKGDL